MLDGYIGRGLYACLGWCVSSQRAHTQHTLRAHLFSFFFHLVHFQRLSARCFLMTRNQATGGEIEIEVKATVAVATAAAAATRIFIHSFVLLPFAFAEISYLFSEVFCNFDSFGRSLFIALVPTMVPTMVPKSISQQM